MRRNCSCRIAVVVSDIDTEIAALEARFAKTRRVKPGMVQGLLTGQIRLASPRTYVPRCAAEERDRPILSPQASNAG
jgi:hypothetical protein